MTDQHNDADHLPVEHRPHRIDSNSYNRHIEFLLVGAGGTGGFVAESLCRLMTGRPASITIVDPDIVEPHNLLRQNFYPQDVGRPKSEALAQRLSQLYQRPISYSHNAVALHDHNLHPRLPKAPHVIITCVDNASARLALDRTMERGYGPWLIDAGNGENWGQVLIGNVNNAANAKFCFMNDICRRLPTPLLQRPDLSYDPPETGPRLDCAAALDLTDQDPTINQLMAALTIQTVRRLISGTLTYMALYADQATGDVTATPATPSNAARAFGVPPHELIRQLQTY